MARTTNETSARSAALAVRAIGSIAGLVLLAAAVLKATHPIQLQQWLSYATEWPAEFTWTAALGIVVFETGLGVAALLAPRAVVPYLISTFTAFALLHAFMFFHPELGRCPCLGPISDRLSASVQHTLLGGGSATLALLAWGVTRSCKSQSSGRPGRPAGVSPELQRTEGAT